MVGKTKEVRRFEYRDEKSSKFWEISVHGNGFTVRYGKIGTDGQTQAKEFADAATAEKQAQKLISEKMGKGYQEVGAETKPSTSKTAEKTKPTNESAKKTAKDQAVAQVEWQPCMSTDRRLIGPYPRVLDLRNYSCPGPDDYQVEQPDVIISNDEGLEALFFPCNEVWYNFAVIENLPNLVEINILGKEFSFGKTLQWLICKNLPKLKKIKVDSDLVWLELVNVNSLQHIDVSKSPKLDYFLVEGAQNIKNISMNKCVKLRDIIGLSLDEKDRLGVASAITEMQGKSRQDGEIYKNMTYTDVEYVMNSINEGIKASARKGFYPFGDDPLRGPCSGREYDPLFRKHGFRLLRPLESVYTGGTGETYAYEPLVHCFWWDDIRMDILQSTGNSSQEDCLDYMLHWESMGDVSDIGRNLSSDEILKLFNVAKEKYGYDTKPERKVYISTAIMKDKRENYQQELSRLGFVLEQNLNASIDLMVISDEGTGLVDNDAEQTKALSVITFTEKDFPQLVQSLKLIHGVAQMK